MSNQYNLGKKKCWSCTYYCGKREYKERIFGSPSIHCDDRGMCSCNKSKYNGKVVKENFDCSKYAQWGVISGAIAKKQAETERLEKHRNEHQSNSTNKASSKDSHTPKTLSDEQLKKIIKILFITSGILLFFILIYECVSRR